MNSLKTAAISYEKPVPKTVADLDVLDISLQINEASKSDLDGNPYTYNYVVLNGDEYRVPDSVLSQLKSILAVNPNAQKFKVNKTGTGLATRYQVVPIV